MSRLGDLIRDRRQSGYSRTGALASSAGSLAMERLDPRNYLFNRSGALAGMFPGLKGHRASPKQLAPQQSSGMSAEQVNSINSNLTRLSSQTRLVAKNTFVLPVMSRDINVMKQGIIKLVKARGGAQRDTADRFFLKASEREALYESQMKKSDAPSKVTTKPDNDSKNTLFSSMFTFFKDLFSKVFSPKGLLIGGILAALNPETTINVIEGLMKGLRSLGLVVLEVAEFMTKAVLKISEVTDMDGGKMLAAGAATAVATWGLGGLAKGLKKYKDAASLARGGGAAVATAASAGAATSAARPGIISRFNNWAAGKGKGKIAQIVTKRLVTGAAGIVSTGLMISGGLSLVGGLLKAGLSLWVVYEIIDEFLLDDKGVTSESEVDAITGEIKNAEDSALSFQERLRNIVTNIQENKKSLESMDIGRSMDAVRETIGIKRHYSKPYDTPKSISPTKIDKSLDSNISKIREKLSKSDLNLSDDDQNAIIANLMKESTLNPNAENPESKAFGLAQWLGTRKKSLIKKYGTSPTFDQQMDFIIQELGGTHKRALDALKTSPDLASKIAGFEKYYEVSGDSKEWPIYKVHDRSDTDLLGRIQFGASLSGKTITEAEIEGAATRHNITVIVDGGKPVTTTAQPAPSSEPSTIEATVASIVDTEFVSLLRRRASSSTALYSM